jgi:hypothetical protein
MRQRMNKNSKINWKMKNKSLFSLFQQ